jgi:hypothetical protein
MNRSPARVLAYAVLKPPEARTQRAARCMLVAIRSHQSGLDLWVRTLGVILGDNQGDMLGSSNMTATLGGAGG